ncbi:NAD(P)H-dependent oxidoreductase [Methylobacterium sp. NEAU 140]|uniref:NAD(P)H-dependent oxidoreductase n=1 Tax=Methylobacterium sp. NEAU 140 TaxID=3064945 RepID=UPI0027355107|nr:NAD(P)H-dependent oxidoreductase [Methylobacterium sp. NEAU 140]MDP4023571.1 NAD(P)H-dependent oxidoreductase [Methylobacterium sp. NEAU 140]
MAEPQVRLLIAFYSRTGSVEALAVAAAEAARGAGAAVRLRRAREVASAEDMTKVEGWREEADRQNALYPAPTHDDAEWADAILLGTPSYFGAPATELKNVLDRLGPQWKKGALSGKVGGAFATASFPHGGSEVVTLALYAPMAHLGMIIVPTGYTDEAMLEAGSPYGASAIVGGARATRGPRISTRLGIRRGTPWRSPVPWSRRARCPIARTPETCRPSPPDRPHRREPFVGVRPKGTSRQRRRRVHMTRETAHNFATIRALPAGQDGAAPAAVAVPRRMSRC